MSKWTHIAGVISVDCFTAIFEDSIPPDKLVSSITGYWENPWYDFKIQCQDDSGEAAFWPNAIAAKKEYGGGANMPAGSEGPLYYTVQNIGSRSCANNAVVTFVGNLRDFGIEEVENKIFPYFDDLIKRYKDRDIYIRNMAISVDTEEDKNYLLTFRNEQLQIWGLKGKFDCKRL